MIQLRERTVNIKMETFWKTGSEYQNMFSLKRKWRIRMFNRNGATQKIFRLWVPLFCMSKISAHAARKFPNYCHTKLVPHWKAKIQYCRLFEESAANRYLDLQRVLTWWVKITQIGVPVTSTQLKFLCMALRTESGWQSVHIKSQVP